VAEEVLDLTSYKALCGDPLVHVVEKARSIPVGSKLKVIMSKSDYEIASKALPNLEGLGIRLVESSCSGERCTIVVERAR
jgi:TusA-related sulfurtransferase